MRFGSDASRRAAERAQHRRLIGFVHRLRQRVEVAFNQRRDRSPSGIGVTLCTSYHAFIDAQRELRHIRIVLSNNTYRVASCVVDKDS